jgi:hypothetical protein
MANYTVFDDGKTIKGDARQVLGQLHAESSRDSGEIKKMSLDKYARAVIEDAPYFLPRTLLKALEKEKFESEYDRALAYLGQMSTSRVRILQVTG